MRTSTTQELRVLRIYSAGATALLLVFSLGAFRQSAQHTRFAEVDAERINIIEPDGTLRLAISSRARFPDPVVGGKAYPLRSGAQRAGMIFFNDEGNENGGLAYSGKANPAGGYQAGGSLTFDQFNQDETIALSYSDVSGRRTAGVTIADRSDKPIAPCADSLYRAMQVLDTAARSRATARLRDACQKTGELASMQRVYLGKSAAKSSLLVLSDRAGKPRLRLTVDSLGAPSMEFLDETGRVTSRLPER